MEEEELKCNECGEILGSRETVEEHFDLEHSGKEVDFERMTQAGSFEVSKYFNRNAAIGFFLGVILTAGAIAGGSYLQERMEDTTRITVVTCEDCTYERFKTTTDRMIEADYREVSYQSAEGEKLTQKYNLSYVPGFIYPKSIEEHENFSQMRNALIKHGDAYVMSDSPIRKAQRFSEGKDLK